MTSSGFEPANLPAYNPLNIFITYLPKINFNISQSDQSPSNCSFPRYFILLNAFPFLSHL
jgi:hypothetical protein